MNLYDHPKKRIAYSHSRLEFTCTRFIKKYLYQPHPTRDIWLKFWPLEVSHYDIVSKILFPSALF